MTANTGDDVENPEHVHSSKMYSTIVLSVSLVSIIVNVLIGFTLVMQYYIYGHPAWATITFSFMFFPSVIMQIFSIKLLIKKKNDTTENMSPAITIKNWLLHTLLLGVTYRYIKAIRKCIMICKSRDSLDKYLEIKKDIKTLKDFYLFWCFLECAPQLVFQLYVIATANNQLHLKELFVVTSVLSIAWALIIHTQAKHRRSCVLLFLIFWRVGMITARVSALVLCVFVCGPWITLFMGAHWLAMTLWITYQKTSSEKKEERGEMHSALVGVIYCFCFFSLRNGKSGWKPVILNLLIVFQNVVFLTVFLTGYPALSSNFAVLSFTTVICGNLIGITSLLFYIKCYRSTELPNQESRLCEQENPSNRRLNFRNKFRIFKRKDRRELGCSRSENKRSLEHEQLQGVQSPSDSIIIIEEGETPNCESRHLAVEKPESIHNDKASPINKSTEIVPLSATLKRRPLCSSADLNQYLEKGEDGEIDSSKSSKVIGSEEAPSEILSTHDYENLCAVNIAREPWGIRSWRGYSDIETWRHDDSVFNERRLDNLTTSSEYSCKVDDRDSLTTAEDDLLQCEVETNSDDKTSVNFLPPLPPSMLHTIFEEESPRGSDSQDLPNPKPGSESTLVATIDKICLYTPLRSRVESIDNYVDSPEVRSVPASKGTVDENIENKVERNRCGAKKEAPLPAKNINRCVRKLSLFKERFEINRYHISGKNDGVCNDRGLKRDVMNKENHPLGSRDVGTKRRFGLKETSSLFVQVLTPSKLEKRTFPITPPKR